MASITGNLCIEYEGNKKPSGINATIAHYWVHYILHTEGKGMYGDIIKEEVYVIPIEILREKVKGCRKLTGGDGGRSKFYLLSKYKLKEYLVDTIVIKEVESSDDEELYSDIIKSIGELVF